MNPLLTLEHVGFAYHQAEGETPALSDISFTLEAGHFLAIVGPSGCGKSTLLSLISGPPSAGGGTYPAPRPAGPGGPGQHRLYASEGSPL